MPVRSLQSFVTLSHDKVSDLSNFKAFAENNLNVAKMLR